MAVLLHYIVIGAADTAPTAAQIVTGTSYTGATVLKAGSVAYTAAGTYDHDASPVTTAAASTSYVQWFVAFDDVALTYGTPVSGTVTTLALAALAATGAPGAFSGTASSPAKAILSAAGQPGAPARRRWPAAHAGRL